MLFPVIELTEEIGMFGNGCFCAGEFRNIGTNLLVNKGIPLWMFPQCYDDLLPYGLHEEEVDSCILLRYCWR